MANGAVIAVHPTDVIREWMNTELAKGGDVREIADRCARALATDDEFCRTFVVDHLPSLAFRIGIAASKNLDGVKRIGSKVLTLTQVAEAIEIERNTNWSKLMQQDVNAGLSAMLRMSRKELLASATRWFSQGDAAYKHGAFYRAIAGTLADDQIVADRWTPEQLDDVFARFSVDVKAQPRLKEIDGDLLKQITMKGDS